MTTPSQGGPGAAQVRDVIETELLRLDGGIGPGLARRCRDALWA